MRTAMKEDIREMVQASRLDKRALRLETSSGSVYHLYPIDDRLWTVVRLGVDGTSSFHDGVVISQKGTDLRVGPWATTGMRDLSFL